MKYLLTIAICIFTLTAMAQKDSMRVNVSVADKSVRQITLNQHQQQWLNLNYKKISLLPRDSALQYVRINFPRTPEQDAAAAEATYEYLISQASKLAAGDNSSQLAQMQQALQELKNQKKSLASQISEKEKQLSTTTDPAKRRKLEREIARLRSQLATLERQIEEKEREIEGE